MSKALYLNDTYMFETPAIILTNASNEKGSYLLLDQTIFYPQGGGQPSDQGLIKGDNFEVNVMHVRQIEQEIRHYTNYMPNFDLITAKVILIIDKDIRMLNARYHTAAHLLGNIVELIYPDLKAIKGHSFPKEAYVEFQGEVLADSNKIIETLKESIDKNLSNNTFNIDAATFEEKFYKLPYQIPNNKSFRAMQIGNLLPVPCGGTHLKNLQEIGDIKIGKIKPKNGITRITYELTN